ncbi:hypothetical protein SAMN02745135_00048 [Caloranaerobacter azorensis DSM 13643]|uniref:Uncharacterized protein n=1 Tax=Caloranaerobacter azorensis DSM 13643 TaxID=1121264 RepID=A0A1M5R3B9_9FIRM|nr:hypothetical protein [Caloranaerobacter azorensis]SHH20520.1 hypothetical protein SAMN02745135_00048 [Caloranaerobacter azorensis DSM 13643]
MREIIFMIFIVILYLILSYLLGLSTTMFILSAILFIMAVLFSYDEQYYSKYIMFITPKRSKITSEKDEVFKKKDRKVSIVSFYIISILLFINGIIKINDKSSYKSLLSTKDFITITGIAFVIGLVSYLIDNYFLKKSKEHEEYLIKSVMLGLFIVVILFIITMLF